VREEDVAAKKKTAKKATPDLATLREENRHLKSENGTLRRKLSRCERDVRGLKDEIAALNRELKKDEEPGLGERLVRAFQRGRERKGK
jgi:septal ring factor EnvC (AmiA/AmiB activator)